MRNRTSPGRPPPPGYTMVEFLLVATVIGLMVTVAAPRIVPTRSAPDQGAQVLMSGLLQAQRLAVTEQRNVIATFEIPERRVVLHVDGNHDGLRGPGERLYHVPLGERVEFGFGGADPRPGDATPVTFETDADGRPAVTFRRNGSASEVGSVYLTAPHARPEDARMIFLSRATGRGILHRYADGEWAPLGRAR